MNTKMMALTVAALTVLVVGCNGDDSSFESLPADADTQNSDDGGDTDTAASGDTVQFGDREVQRDFGVDGLEVDRGPLPPAPVTDDGQGAAEAFVRFTQELHANTLQGTWSEGDTVVARNGPVEQLMRDLTLEFGQSFEADRHSHEVRDVSVGNGTATVEGCVLTHAPRLDELATDRPVNRWALVSTELERDGDQWKVMQVDGLDWLLDTDGAFTGCGTHELAERVAASTADSVERWARALGAEDGTYINDARRFDGGRPQHPEFADLMTMVQNATNEEGVNVAVGDLRLEMVEFVQVGDRNFELTVCLAGTWGALSADEVVVGAAEGEGAVLRLTGKVDDSQVTFTRSRMPDTTC